MLLQKKKLLVTVLALLLSGIFTSCKNQSSMNTDTKFEWWSAWDAPRYYPMEVLDGAFLLKGQYQTPLRQGFTQGQKWGGNSDEMGEGERPLPDELDVYWYSFTEDKFYEGAFKLPQDTMLKLFREGFNQFRFKKHVTYDYITVGLAPGGVVSVWLKGNWNGKEVEVGYFKAHEGERLTWEHFDSEYYRSKGDSAWTAYRREMLDGLDAADHLKRYGIPFGIWDTYREKFNFRPVMVYEDKDTARITDEIHMEFFNGEEESLSLNELKENPFKMRARIRYFEAFWTFGQNMRYIQLEFDEQELFNAYKDVYEGNPNTQVELQIHMNKENDHFDQFLVRVEKGNYKEVQLRHTKINFYIDDVSNRYHYNVFKNDSNNN